MKINNISPNINFGKVIEIEKDKYDEHNAWNGFLAEKAVVNVLNNEKYTKTKGHYGMADAQQIRDFFEPLLGKDKEKIIFRYYDGKKYLITGKEAKDVLAIEKFVKDAREMKYPETDYVLLNGTSSDGFVKRKIKTFAQDMAIAAEDKCRCLARSYVRNDSNPIKLKMTYGNSYNKIHDFEATIKSPDGTTKTKTLNLKA